MAITDRILGYWAGGDTSDSSGNGHTLTANGTSPAYVTGKVGNAFDCDKTNTTYWSIANASAGAFQLGTKSQSGCLWLYLNATPVSNTQIFSFGGNWSGGLDPGYGLHIESTGKILTRFSDGSTWAGATSTTVLSTSTWYHIRWVVDRGGYFRVWINGALDNNTNISSYSATSISATRDFEIGGTYYSYNDALIDEVMIWDGCMSGDVSSILYAGGTGAGYSTLSAITRPYVAQEWFFEQETNTTHAEVQVSDLVAGDVAVAVLQTDGNVSSVAAVDWDAAWTLEGSTQTSLFTGMRVFSKVVTSTDVSTETEMRVNWTNNEKAVLYLFMLDNAADVNAASVTDNDSGLANFTAPGVTTTADGCLIINAFGIDSGPTVTSYDAGLTFWDYQVTNSAGHVGLWVGAESQATAGATGTYAYTVSAATYTTYATIAIEPAATGGATVGASAVDGITFSDAASTTLAALASALDGVTLSDTASVSAALLSAAADGLSLSDVAAVVAQYVSASADGVVFTDAATAIVSLGAGASDGLVFGDSATATLRLYASASDGFVFSDTATFPTGAAYAAATVTIAAAIAASVSLQAAINASVTIKPD